MVSCCGLQIRLVVEEGLNQLPYRECIITTPTGQLSSDPVCAVTEKSNNSEGQIVFDPQNYCFFSVTAHTLF